METPNNDLSSFNAVMLGALASGVNGPTWLVLRMVFLMLGVCLTAMLALAFSSSDFAIAGHVLLLVIISAMLFIFLNGFLAQTGLVSVGQQMAEMGLPQKEEIEIKIKKEKQI